MKITLGRFSGAAVLVVLAGMAQAQMPMNHQEETAHPIADGGIKAAGWEGSVDPPDAKKGLSVKDDRFVMEGKSFKVTTGPAATFWNPANKASGDYTVSATFAEPKYMNLNDHPHPYGIVIGGNDLGTAQQSYVYCAAYGNGNFIVRGFGPDAFQMNGRRGGTSDAVHKAAGPGEPVTQQIAMQVKSDTVSCIVNGTVVGTYPKSDLVTAGKLKSTDGLYGIRFAHNTDAVVTDLKVTKP